MKEIVKVNLENEMDLILANKRTMKLAEHCALSLTEQTALATAVSEIGRCALSKGKSSVLKLGLVQAAPNKKQIAAIICNISEDCLNADAISFAKRLVNRVEVLKVKGSYDIHLYHALKFSVLISDSKIQDIIDYFKTEPPLSPYDELRKKNMLLLDISEKLRESENQYREFTNTLPLMMFSANPEGEIIYKNQWLEKYFGATLTSVKPFSGQSIFIQEDYQPINAEWEIAFKGRKNFRAQGRLKNAENGTFLWHLISIRPVKNEDGSVIQWTGFFVDIHAQKLVEETLKDNQELKEAQKNLVEYQKRLEEKISELNISNHELEQFAYIASHDLQEPLRKIITFSSLLRDQLPDLNETSSLYFSKIIASSKRMTELIRDVLDWSSVARVKEERSPIDLNILLETVVNNFELPIQQKQAVIEISPLPLVSGVASQLTQLFNNLISNAIKFSTKPPVIKIIARDLTADEIKGNPGLNHSYSYSEIQVIDEGIGFDSQYSDRIFKIFQRLNGRSEYEGTGIGLAICKRIMENHAGLITATSQPESGATFSIIIPTWEKNASERITKPMTPEGTYRNEVLESKPD